MAAAVGYGAMKPTNLDVEETRGQLNRIRITLSSRNVKNLERAGNQRGESSVHPNGSEVVRCFMAIDQDWSKSIHNQELQCVVLYQYPYRALTALLV